MAKAPKPGNICLPLISDIHRNECSTGDGAALSYNLIPNTKCIHFKYTADLGILPYSSKEFLKKLLLYSYSG